MYLLLETCNFNVYNQCIEKLLRTNIRVMRFSAYLVHIVANWCFQDRLWTLCSVLKVVHIIRDF